MKQPYVVGVISLSPIYQQPTHGSSTSLLFPPPPGTCQVTHVAGPCRVQACVASCRASPMGSPLWFHQGMEVRAASLFSLTSHPLQEVITMRPQQQAPGREPGLPQEFAECLWVTQGPDLPDSTLGPGKVDIDHLGRAMPPWCQSPPVSQAAPSNPPPTELRKGEIKRGSARHTHPKTGNLATVG